MTTNAPNENNKLSLPETHSPKPPDKKYPVIHSEHEVVVHPPIKKSKCPYCNFVNDDGSHRTRGENFYADEKVCEMNITGDNEIVCKIKDNPRKLTWSVYSIKIPYCPFCRRKL